MLDEVAALQKTLAKIRLFGPRSREDLVTIFAIENGMVDIPDGALHRPEKWYHGADQSITGEYKRGLLNLKRAASIIMPGKTPQKRHDPLNFAGELTGQAGPYASGSPASAIVSLFGRKNRGFSVQEDWAGPAARGPWGGFGGAARPAAAGAAAAPAAIPYPANVYADR